MTEPTTSGPPVPGVKLFSTSPQSREVDRDAYRDRVTEIARWSEAAGCEGILVYTENGIVDPWLVAQLILQATERICPLIAVQPTYMHPYSVAKMIASFGHLHRRRVYLNLVAGGFVQDLEALGDLTAHDERYARAREYGQIITGLAAGGAFTLQGDYYNVRNLWLAPPIDPDLQPGLMISGSSPAGMAVAAELGAISIKYPQPSDLEPAHHDEPVEVGMRIGVIARDDATEAWEVAHERFPESRAGAIAQRLAGRVSDSSWHRQLSALVGERTRPVYWLGPFENYASFCPYLVGDYDTVGDELARYLGLGFSTFVLDIPEAEEDLRHTVRTFRQAATLR